MNKHERRYAVTETECLAVVWSCNQFRHYLLGNKFTIRTDHSALAWLSTVCETTNRLARWAIVLGEFDFTIEYRKGKNNANADYVSRVFRKDLNYIARATEPNTDNTMIRAQQDDPWCQGLKLGDTFEKRNGLIWEENLPNSR